MILSRLTWQDVEALDREIVVLIPTGSLEQHGPHLPLFTDSLIATAVADGVERALPGQVLLTPTLWLGASGHHLKFPGSLSNSFEGYEESLLGVVESLIPHGFRKFYVVNGHGGNTEPNGVAMRKLKAKHPNLTFGHSGYFAFCEEEVAAQMKGPAKGIQHACEAETSLIMHLHPELVRKDKLCDDGLFPQPHLKGVVHHFDEMSELGSIGYATYADPKKGQRILEAAIQGVAAEIATIADGYVLTQP